MTREAIREEALDDAKRTVENFTDEIVEMILDDGEASNNLFNDYASGYSYHHENHVDKDYNLSEAAEILDALSQYEETDSGLWESLKPRMAIAAQAAYTYGNAVFYEWKDLIKQINDEVSDLELTGEDREADEAKIRAMIKERIS